MLYFAYGSNMYTPRLKYRVSSAKPVGSAVIQGYELRWHKRSNDGSGKCNIIPSDALGITVVGVVFDIDPSEKKKLDSAEGAGFGYHEKTIAVSLKGKLTEVRTYIAGAKYIDEALPVYTWYKDFVVSGAKEHKLPELYVEALALRHALFDPRPGKDAEERGRVA
jgi:hypothetical protein